ncbi:MAG: NTP transferase domain-containing protein [Candidatus Hodarchaeota archaeon]
MNVESIILAAGCASRFDFRDSSYKKYLLPFARSNILNYIIVGMIKAGIKKINLIVDMDADTTEIKKSCFSFLKNISFKTTNISLNFIENDNIERENGYSLFLGAKNVNSEFFILSMADHIFSVNVYEELIKKYNNQDIVLATDPIKIIGHYDLEDCTKVLGYNAQIKEIGKQIENYNRLDMGAFLMKTKTIKRISQFIEKIDDKFGVSDILLSAINLDFNVSYLDFPDTIWLDVDNHNEYEKLKQLFNKTSKYRPFNLDILIKKSLFNNT